VLRDRLQNATRQLVNLVEDGWIAIGGGNDHGGLLTGAWPTASAQDHVNNAASCW
jgi:hypothetical protein